MNLRTRLVTLVGAFLFLQRGYSYTINPNLSSAVDRELNYTSPYKYIAHGSKVDYDEFPFMAALGWEKNGTNSVDYLCGGMLITPNMVLTAAHCVFFKGRLPDRVAIGFNYLSEVSVFYRVRDYYIYPEYHHKRAYHDIAILVLLDSTRFDSPQLPVCLWTQPILHSPNVTAIGYGAEQFAGERTSYLLKVNLFVYPETVCKPYFRRQRKFPSGLLQSHLCAGDPEKLRDTCQGDSGGPLIYKYKQILYVVGITSSGQACSGFPPAIYTRISSYIPWIKSKAKEQGYTIRDNCE